MQSRIDLVLPVTMKPASMKGGGFYDTNSSLQRRAIEDLRPLIVEAMERVPLPDSPDQPMTLVDYGCSEGRNSILAMRYALDALRKRRADQTVQIVHEDLPTNNFNRLFENLHNSVDNGGPAQLDSERVFVFASGTDFFDQVVPDASARFGISSFSVQWLSETPPVVIADHIFHARAGEEEKRRLAERAESDWITFLTRRSRELVRGGRLVLSVPGSLGDPELGQGGRGIPSRYEVPETVSLQRAQDAINEVLKEMASERAIDEELYKKFVWPFYFRTVDELTAPIASPGSVLRDMFAVERVSVDKLSCPLRERYEQTGDSQEYAKFFVGWIRAWSEAVLAKHLIDAGGDPSPASSAAAVVETFYQRLFERVAATPEQLSLTFFMVKLLLRKL